MNSVGGYFSRINFISTLLTFRVYTSDDNNDHVMGVCVVLCVVCVCVCVCVCETAQKDPEFK